MKDYLGSEVRNIVLLGHSGTGKTDICEACLLYTKSIDRFGKTEDGNSVSDYDPEEIKRGQSIYTSVVPIEFKNCKLNFIDTPGYLDYDGELKCGLAVADNALIVISAKDKVQSSTAKAFKLSRDKNLPTIFFVNKIDEENASFDDAYADLRDKFGKIVIAFEMPIIENNEVVGSVNILRKKAWYYNDNENSKAVPENLVAKTDEYYDQIVEAIAMGDDDLMEKFFNGEVFDEHDIAKGLRIGVRSGEICPVYCGSARKGTGIERLLDLIIEYFPTYGEIGTVSCVNDRGVNITLQTNEQEALSVFVYKTIVDPFVGKISFVKVMSGVLSADSSVYNADKDEMEKINSIYFIRGKYQVAVGKLFTGDIGAIVKLQHTQTNDTLSTKMKPVLFERVDYTKPMLGVAVWPKTKNDEDKMSFAIAKILEEDLSVKFVKNRETKEQVLYGLGDQQLDVIINKLKNKYKVEILTTVPTVQYRETIMKCVEAEGKHKKQSGGAGQYGHVKIKFEPCECEEMEFVEDVFGGSVPRQYFPAVEQGLREAMEKGVLAGFKVVGVKATLYDGSYHDVDSKEIAFKAAARLAYKDGMLKAKPILLEPIGKVEVLIPDEYLGVIIGDFNKRRGIIMGMDVVDDYQKISAEVPMAEMQKYATELRSMTQGRGEYFIEFDHYDNCPELIAQRVVKETKAKLEE